MFKRLFLVVGLVASCAGLSLAREAFISLKKVDHGVREVHGGFYVEVPRPIAWQVLTDYNFIQTFVSSIQSNCVTEHHGGSVVIEQVFLASYLFFHRRLHVLLKIQEKPPDTILFEDTSGQDFIVYSGSWRLEKFPGSTRVVYHLRARLRSAAPGWVAQNVLSKSVQQLLYQVRAEMVRRKKTSFASASL